MSVFKDYEAQVLRLLASSVLSPQQLEILVREGEFIDCEYTGCGYFLSIKHASLPRERIVCSEPILNGSADDINCGFVIFIESGQLMLECYMWEDKDMPESFRDRDVKVTVV